MRWEDERYVRVYTRDTVDWQMLSFDAQALLLLLLRKVDRAGLLALGKPGKKGVAVAIGHPREWERLGPALEELLEDGCVRMTPDGSSLFVPNFLAAQEAPSSDKQRKAESRAKAREVAAAESILDGASRIVTACHATTRPVTTGPLASGLVTPSRTVPCCAEPSHSSSASQGTSAPDPSEDLPDATADAVEVPERPALELLPSPPDVPEAKPEKAPRKPSKAEVLYAGLEEDREEASTRAGLKFIPLGWPPARINKQLGPLAKVAADSEEAKELNAALEAFLDDPRGAAFNPPWDLGMFIVRLAEYKSRALRAAGGVS